MKVVVGLGNPGAEYDATRHNVGWWVVDRAAYEWDFEPFRHEGHALVTQGEAVGRVVRLMKPVTYMNRSGAALKSVLALDDFEPAQDLLIVVDDATIDVGRIRLRREGGAGGHNGLRSIAGALRSNDYARLRVGVGKKPEGADLSDWVLSRMPEAEEDVVVGLLPELTRAIEAWLTEGMETAMNRFNR